MGVELSAYAPTCVSVCSVDKFSLMSLYYQQALLDAVEHRHGKQRVPLVSGGVGTSVCVNDINSEELKGAIEEVWALHDVAVDSKRVLG